MSGGEYFSLTTFRKLSMTNSTLFLILVFREQLYVFRDNPSVLVHMGQVRDAFLMNVLFAITVEGDPRK